jgi:hypothetical protein
MDPQVARDIAAAVTNGSITSRWWFYALLLVLPAIGAFVASIGTTLFSEHTKGRISRQTWLSQESWKEKFKLYMELLDAVDSVFHAANVVAFDSRVFSVLPPNGESSIADGLSAFPEHQDAINEQTSSMGKIVQLSLKAQLLLPKESNDALEPVRNAYVRATHIISISYHTRESALAIAAGESKTLLVASAKKDLGV